MHTAVWERQWMPHIYIQQCGKEAKFEKYARLQERREGWGMVFDA